MSDLELLDEQTDLLLRTARAVEDLGAPSLCEGWTRGHVLAHLARNADGLARAGAGVLDGSRASMYDSQESRDAEIEAGAGRSHGDAVADLVSSAVALRDVLGRIGPERATVGIPRLTDGPDFFTAERLPTMRLREVVYHHVDLDAGFGFGDLPADLLVRYIRNETARYAKTDGAPAFRIRTDEGDHFEAGEGGPLVTGARGAVLLWLARQRPDGVSAGDTPLPELPKGG
jgi:maleylpyruvate isomerase